MAKIEIAPETTFEAALQAGKNSIRWKNGLKSW